MTEFYSAGFRAGFEAAKEEYADEIERLRDLLQNLLDVQNGPPLIRDAADWQKAVDDARSALKEKE